MALLGIFIILIYLHSTISEAVSSYSIMYCSLHKLGEELMAASENGDISTVASLLQVGVDPNVIGEVSFRNVFYTIIPFFNFSQHVYECRAIFPNKLCLFKIAQFTDGPSCKQCTLHSTY